MAKDMTKGNPGKTLFFFAVPMVLGNLFQQLYNIIDSIIVGNYVGADALAAVGASSSITFLFVAVATGLSIGSSVVISQYFGAKRYGEMKTAIQTVLLASFVIALCLMLVGIFGTDAILRFMRTPQKIFSDASLYLKIYFGGLIFLFLYNMLTASFNAIGDSKSPLVFLALSSVCNIVLDLYFVTKLKLGVAGAALATDISQAISVVVSFLWLCTRMRKMKTEEKSKVFDLRIFQIVCNVAVPSMLQQSMVSIGIFLVQRLVNGYGEAVMAGYAAATKIDSIAILPMVNVGNAVSTFTAQNIGGKKPGRVKEGFRAGFLMSAVIGAVVTGILLIYAKVFVGLFMDSSSNQAAIATGIEYLHVVGLFYALMGIMNTCTGVLRGAGDILWFLMVTLINLSSRVILAYSMSGMLGAKAIWWSIPIGWGIGFAIGFVRCLSGKWQRSSLIE